MWTYSQTTGLLMHDNQAVGTCYSGHGAGVDNPTDENIPDVGPIPVGIYTIGSAFTHPVAGPVCMRLTANEGTETFGRDGFMMHGDNAAMNHTASEGCIIAEHAYRVQAAAAVAAGDNQLTVTE